LKRLVLLSATFLFVLGSTYGVARPCSCVPPLPPEEEYARVDAVLKGTVFDISLTTPPDYLDVQVIVSGYWKGTVVPLMHVYTPLDEASCGFEFEIGTEYLIYAFDSTEPCCPTVVTGICTRTRVLSSAQEDLDYLGDPLPVPVDEVTWGVVKAMYKD